MTIRNITLSYYSSICISVNLTKYIQKSIAFSNTIIRVARFLQLLKILKIKLMKKLLTLSAIALLGFSASAQMNSHFKIGANVGAVVGDASNYASVTAGADVAY